MTRPPILLHLAFAATVPLALLAACNPVDASTLGLRPGTGVIVAAESSGVTAGQTRDEAVTAEVARRLARDPDLAALEIDVHTAAGRVVLRGSVPSTALRDRATQLSGSVDGVAAVDNELDVQQR